MSLQALTLPIAKFQQQLIPITLGHHTKVDLATIKGQPLSVPSNKAGISPPNETDLPTTHEFLCFCLPCLPSVIDCVVFQFIFEIEHNKLYFLAIHLKTPQIYVTKLKILIINDITSQILFTKQSILVLLLQNSFAFSQTKSTSHF